MNLNDLEIPVEYIARFAHEINKSYCEAIGDNSQPSWKDAPDWQKESAINGVTFHLNNPNVTPEQSHENWKKQKIEEGWIHGDVKDPEKKIHPCIVEKYSDLPLEQRVKDHLFATTVRNFLLTSIK